MKHWAYCKNGFVEWVSQSPDFAIPTPLEGFTAVELAEPLPAAPFEGAAYDIQAQQWVDSRTLEEVKRHRWNAIKQERAEREYAGFAWDGSAFDSDPLSQSRIQGAVQLASLDLAGFSIDWTLADNTVRTLSGANMVAVGVALAQHVNALHVTARGLRAQIEAAATLQEVAAIAWPAA